MNDAKSRVKQIDIAGYRRMREAGEAHSWWTRARTANGTPGHVKGAVHLGKGIIERDIETRCPDKATTPGALLRRRFPLRPGRR